MAEIKELTFWDHLDELRRVLFRIIGVWFVLAVGYFIAMPYLFDHVILAPCHNDFIFYHLLRDIGQAFDLTDDFFTREFKVKLVNINLAAPFFIHMSTAFWMSVVTATPYLFFEIWRFIRPALYPNERKGVRKALTIGTVMFFYRSPFRLFHGLSAHPSFSLYLSTQRRNRESDLPELLHRQFYDAGALHGAGFRTTFGNLVAFLAWIGKQIILTKIPETCHCPDCHRCCCHYSNRRPFHTQHRSYSPLSAL